MRLLPPTSGPTRHVVRHAVLAAIGAAAVAWLGPPGTDLAAHVYQRALFLQHGFELWNNYWYAGRYSFVGYSLLYYPLAALLGIKLLAVCTAAIAAGAFASIVQREWPAAGHWPARAFTLVAAASVITGAYPYALGLACALLALRFLRPLRTWPFVACVLLAFAASPLAFALLLIVLVSIAAAGSPRVHRARGPVVAVVAIACAAGLIWRLFPDNGTFPFSSAELAATLLFCVLGVAFTVRVPASRVLLRFFVLYALASIASFLVPSGVGENIARLRFVALPLAVLAVALRRWRPVVPTAAALLLAASWNVTPLAFSLAHSTADPSSAQSYWTPVVPYLKAHLQPSYRVEAVDTAGHWEAVYLPQNTIPIVRGWFRQDDFPENALLYKRLGARAYLGWLHRMGVAYVVLTDAPVDYSARGEAALLRSGRSGLKPVYSTAHAAVFAVPHPLGIVSGARGAHVVKLAPAGMTLALPHAGAYRIAVRYSPYWQTTSGCVTARKDGMTQLVVRDRGWVRFTFDVTAHHIVEAGVGAKPDCDADHHKRG